MRRIMTDSVGYAPVPITSPDGRWLVWILDRSDRESTILVRAASGGEPRQLTSAPGLYRGPQFSPQGDRLLFQSSIPRRGPSDEGMYLMAAPFDTRTGTLSGAPRQVTLDGIRAQPRFRFAIAPDGQRVAYVDNISSAVKVVPITGGNATTLVTPPPGSQQRNVPGWLVWTPDGRSLVYDARESQGPYARYRISATGGTPVVVARTESDRGFGRPIPGTDMTVDLVPLGAGKPWVLRFNDGQGKQIGSDLEVPGLRVAGQFFPSVDGKQVILAYGNVKSAIHIVPTAGGPNRIPVAAVGYDWPMGWSADSKTFFAFAEGVNGMGYFRGATVDGQVVAEVALRQPAVLLAVLGDRLIESTYSEGATTLVGPSAQRAGSAITISAVRPADGTRTEIARGVSGSCCRAPGGAYNFSGDRVYFLRKSGNRLEVRQLGPTGSDDLVADLPMPALTTEKAVGGKTVAYLEPAGDALKLMVKQAGTPATTIATYTRTQIPRTGEFVFSFDGRQLAVSIDEGRTVEIFQFDAAGRVTGTPRRISLPVAYQYEMFWLPDGSGFTCVAQMRDQPFPHVALVRLNDPGHPVLLTRDDPLAKWGHALSPDGRYVAYQSEETHGGSAWAIDVARALELARRR